MLAADRHVPGQETKGWRTADETRFTTPVVCPGPGAAGDGPAGLLGAGSCCLHGRGGLGPGDYPSVPDQLAIHLRLDWAGGEFDDVDCCLAG